MKTYEEINEEVNNTIGEIFANCDIKKLSNYEKRRKIFKHLCDSIEYDYELFSRIKETVINHTRMSRDPRKEFQSVVFKKIGICNAISQFYKLLLENIGIKSHCVICDDGTDVNHQLNLVYDQENDSYSFDDVTSVIVGRGSEEEFFDYDLDYANSIDQGNKYICEKYKYLVLWEDYVNYVVKRSSNPFSPLKVMPHNIRSTKNIANNNINVG